MSKREAMAQLLEQRTQAPTAQEHIERAVGPSAPTRTKDGQAPKRHIVKAVKRSGRNDFKLTAYLSAEEMQLLEGERQRRRFQLGMKPRQADMSTLIREAIRRTYGSR